MSPILESLWQARIWIVDDEPANVTVLLRILQRNGYENVGGSTNPREALERFARDEVDLILLDLNMPGLDGFGVLEELRLLRPEGAYLPVVAVTAMPTADAKQRALALGAHDFVRKPFEPAEILLRIRNLLETRSLHLQMDEKVRARTQALEQAKLEVLRRLARAAEYRDDDTGQHTQRVGELSARLALALGLERDAVEMIRQAAPLHDVGKIGVPDAILLKRGPLTEEEFEVIKAHTRIGAELLSGGISPVMDLAEVIARSHHERWDGSGYPDGLRGEEIPLAARIVAAADFFDALSHDRPYRKAWPLERIVAEIREQSGRHFDPRVAGVVLRICERTAGKSRAEVAGGYCIALPA